jgi:iron complex outermembrane receptor protein
MKKLDKPFARGRMAKAILTATALPLAFTPVPAYAVLEEVIVTATKRKRSIQEVPVAVTAFSTESLDNLVMLELRDLQEQTPSLIIGQVAGTSASPFISLRGQIQSDPSVSTLDPSVGIYIDEVYVGRAQGSMVEMFDIASVEILKGTQGTLYGRNTTGGAIKIATIKPEPGEPVSGYVGGAIGNFESERYEGAVSFPLGETAAMRIAARHNESDGWAEALTVDPDTGATTASSPSAGRDADLFRASLVWDATEALRISVGGEYYKNDDVAQLTKDLGGDRFRSDFTFDKTADFHAAGASFSAEGTIENRSVDLTVDYSFDSFDVKAIFAHREFEFDNLFDVDGTSYDALALSLGIEGEQQSFELQFSGLALNDRLDWLTGLFYFEEDNEDSTQIDYFGFLIDYPGDSRTESMAAYAHLVYAITDDVNLTGGLRYTEDTKELDGANRLAGGCVYDLSNPDVSDPGFDYFGAPAGCSISSSEDFDFVSWALGLDWQIADSSMVYAKAGTGQRSGGLQMRGTGLAFSEILGKVVNTNAPFDEEEVLEYEVGIKNEFLDGRARLNLSYYYTDYTEYQTSEVISVSTFVLNLGDATIQGVELEASIELIDGLLLGGFYSWIDFEYDDPDIESSTPGSKWGVSVNYAIPASYGEWNTSLSYSYKDETGNASENIWLPIDAYGLVNGRIGLDLENGIRVSVFGRNLTDEEYIYDLLSSFVADPSIGLDPNNFAVANMAEPRTYGVEFRCAF